MRVLVVEDDMIVAGSLCPLVHQAGHELVGLAADKNAAIELLASTTVDLALIDVCLADGCTGFDVAKAANDRGVPFVFTTANFRLLFDDLPQAVGIIGKPYDDGLICAALKYLDDAFRNGGNAGAPPRGFVLSLQWIERLALSPELSLAPAA